MRGQGLISLMLLMPVVGALLISAVPPVRTGAIRAIALLASLITFAVSVLIFTSFSPDTYHMQLVEQVPWIHSLGISYKVGVDGISIWLLLLTTFLTTICVWFSVYIKERIKAYMASLLILETAMLGVFVSLDLILFYTFFEASLIPMYFLIAIWGGARRAYASIKFFLYTFSGSIFMLVGIIGLHLLYREKFAIPTFDIVRIQEAVASGQLWAGSESLQQIFFWAFAVGFLIKCPAFPFHTWLPDAHVEAPTAGSVILAGVLLKMGTYGFLRFCLPFFPEAATSNAPVLLTLAVIGILYGAVVSAVQPDLKKLIAYSSVAHMGFVIAGIFSFSHVGMMGGSMQQLNHGVSTGALFLLVGLLYERRHTRMFRDFGGLKARMPVYAAIFLIVMLSSVGLPGTNGFIGEFLALMGLFESSIARAFGLNPIYPVLAGFGVVLAAVYLLSMFMKTFYGPLDNPENMRLRDIKRWEVAMCSTFVILILWAGLFPNTFLQPMEKSVAAARLMVLAPAGSRPTWNDPSLELNDGLDLVRIADRGRTAVGDRVSGGTLVYPASLRFNWRAAEETRSDATAIRAAGSDSEALR